MARQIEVISPEVRSKLDELKRIELERLRKLTMKEHQLELEMEHEQKGESLDDNNVDGRRWRTIGQKTKKSPMHIPLGTVFH